MSLDEAEKSIAAMEQELNLQEVPQEPISERADGRDQLDEEELTDDESGEKRPKKRGRNRLHFHESDYADPKTNTWIYKTQGVLLSKTQKLRTLAGLTCENKHPHTCKNKRRHRDPIEKALGYHRVVCNKCYQALKKVHASLIKMGFKNLADDEEPDPDELFEGAEQPVVRIQERVPPKKRQRASDSGVEGYPSTGESDELVNPKRHRAAPALMPVAEGQIQLTATQGELKNAMIADNPLRSQPSRPQFQLTSPEVRRYVSYVIEEYMVFAYSTLNQPVNIGDIFNNLKKPDFMNLFYNTMAVKEKYNEAARARIPSGFSEQDLSDLKVQRYF